MPGRVDIRPVRSRAELTAFLQVPFRIYKDDPRWVPPLWIDRRAFFDLKKNPFYQTAEVALYLAFKNGLPCGRIAACINHDYNEFHSCRAGSFGFFECPNEVEVAHALFQTASDWIGSRGMDHMLGPLNFSSNHELGMLAHGFDLPPVVMMPYNPPYYLELAESWGFTKAKDLWAFRLTNEHDTPDRVRRIADRVKKRSKVMLRSLNMRHFEEEIDRIREIYNRAWSRNWGFVPLRQEEFRHIARDLKLIVRPGWAFMAEVDGRPIGFSLTLPNVYESQVKIRSGRLLPTGLFRLLWDLKVKGVQSGRVITMGVIHEYQKQGIETVFYSGTFDRCHADGVRWVEISWVLEDNDMMVMAAKALGAEHYKTYRVFEQRI